MASNGAMAHNVAVLRNEFVADSVSEKAIGPAAEASTPMKLIVP